MSHKKIFENVKRAIDNGKLTIDKAIENVEIDLVTYRKLKDSLINYVEVNKFDLTSVAKRDARAKIVETGNNIDECVELQKSLTELKNQ